MSKSNAGKLSDVGDSRASSARTIGAQSLEIRVIAGVIGICGLALSAYTL